MTQLGSFLLLIGVAPVTLAAIGAVIGWYNEEGRRIRRGLRRVLKGETHALIIAPGRGRGAGFNFTSNTMAVAWDTGAWCLVYRIDEVLGLELIVDGQVAGRTFRGEQRRPVDVLGGAEKQVALRLVFDDLRYPDFSLELWSAARAGRRGEMEPAEAVEEGNRWLARLESVFRRKPSAVTGGIRRELTPVERELGRAAAAAPSPQPEPPPPPAPPAPPRPAPAISADGRQELPFDEDPAEFDDPPFDLDEDDDDKAAR